jgi:Na+-driven multidrug efflux pump
MNYFIAAQGFAVESMKTTLIGAIINIILDPICIFVLKMGVQGAALASITAQFCSAVWVVLFLIGKKTKLRIQKRYLMPKLNVLLPVLSLGISPFIMVTTESAVQSSFNIQMRAYGGNNCDTLIAGIGIMLTVMQISMLIPQSLGQGAQPIISFNYGAGNYKRIKSTFFILLFGTAVVMIPTTIICAIVPEFFGKIFSTDTATIAVVKKYLPVFMAGLGICCVLTTCQMSFMALGQAVRSLCIAILRKLVLLIPLMFILPHFIGIDGIIMSEPIADIGAAITAGVVFWLFSRKIFK